VYVCVRARVCGCFEFLPRKRELPEICLSKSLSQSGEDEAFILSSAVMKMHAMKLRKTLELLTWVGSPHKSFTASSLAHCITCFG
jgi:hypothetical protein